MGRACKEMTTQKNARICHPPIVCICLCPPTVCKYAWAHLSNPVGYQTAKLLHYYDSIYKNSNTRQSHYICVPDPLPPTKTHHHRNPLPPPPVANNAVRSFATAVAASARIAYAGGRRCRHRQSFTASIHPVPTRAMRQTSPQSCAERGSSPSARWKPGWKVARPATSATAAAHPAKDGLLHRPCFLGFVLGGWGLYGIATCQLLWR